MQMLAPTRIKQQNKENNKVAFEPTPPFPKSLNWVKGRLDHFTLSNRRPVPRFFPFLLFKQPQNLLDHLPVFQEDGQEDGVHRPGTGHVNPGAGMHFGPVKKTVKRLLVFLAQSPPESPKLLPFPFHNLAKSQNRPSHFPLPDIYRAQHKKCNRQLCCRCPIW